MAGAQAAPPARAATRRHGATRTVSIAAHVENLHPHHDGRPCRQRAAPRPLPPPPPPPPRPPHPLPPHAARPRGGPPAPARAGPPGRRECGPPDRLRPPRPVVPARPPADHAAFG